ncbi:MAG: hypothetical protein WCX61_05060 [Candidatus Peribacteraceae bacterium]
MEVRPHPHWPKDDPQTLQELKEHLLSHFRFLFGNPKNSDDIRQVLAWLQLDSPDVLHWEEADAFCTLFSPFHTGQSFMKEMLDGYVFPERLKNFLDICTSLERNTDQFAYLEKWEDVQHKEIILADLKRFLDGLPSQESFEQLVESIQKK